jgi:hypothetical protein
MQFLNKNTTILQFSFIKQFLFDELIDRNKETKNKRNDRPYQVFVRTNLSFEDSKEVH